MGTLLVLMYIPIVNDVNFLTSIQASFPNLTFSIPLHVTWYRYLVIVLMKIQLLFKKKQLMNKI